MIKQKASINAYPNLSNISGPTNDSMTQRLDDSVDSMTQRAFSLFVVPSTFFVDKKADSMRVIIRLPFKKPCKYSHHTFKVYMVWFLLYKIYRRIDLNSNGSMLVRRVTNEESGTK
jgi:hypothetical protein